MPLSAGNAIGPYQILDVLGAGGMGEVYRARDTRLGREVALKVLPQSFASDSQRLRRFEQEARAAAALNHPNILAVYDIGTYRAVNIEGTPAVAAAQECPYIVSELLEGGTLRERLHGGALPTRKAIDYAQQIAHGLAAAHGKGIMHRDLKPENIFVTQDGRVKILDFGLAKLTGPDSRPDTQTLTAAVHSDAGSVLGTVGYMSPEQVRGAQLDHRTDIFSFGAVLYEIIAGRRAFQKDSGVETMNAILKEEPPEFSDTQLSSSPGLGRIVRRCLEKSPEQRFQSASDLAFALEALSGTTGTSAAVPALPVAPRRRWRAAVAVLALAAMAMGLFLGRRWGRERPPTFRQLVSGPGVIHSARFTPDGQNVVYGASWRGKPSELFSTGINSIESRSLELPPASVAGISKSGEMLLFLGWHSRFQWSMTGTLARVPLSGGAPRPLLEDVCGGDIHADGKQIVAVRCGGTQQTLEYPLGKALFRTNGWVDHVHLAPDGSAIALLDHPIAGDDRGYVAWLDLQGKATRVTDEWSGLKGLAWSAGGQEIWFSGSHSGEPEAIWAVDRAGRLRRVFSGPADTWLQDIGPDGKALLLQARSSNDIAVRRPGQRADQIVDLVSETGSLAGISDNGSLMALSYTGTGSGSDYLTYVVNTDTHQAIRLGDGDPSGISPDGKWVLSFFPSSPGKMMLYPTGPGETRTFTLSNLRNVGIFCSWTSDSSQAVFAGSEGDKPPRGYLLELNSGKWRPITPEGTSSVLLAPNGKYVIAKSELNGFQLFPLEGGEPLPAKGISPGEEPVQWDGRSSSIYVWDRHFPAHILLVNPWTGERKPSLETMPPDPSGVLYGNFFITPDGKTYAYRFRRVLTTLFLAEGLR